MAVGGHVGHVGNVGNVGHVTNVGNRRNGQCLTRLRHDGVDFIDSGDEVLEAGEQLGWREPPRLLLSAAVRWNSQMEPSDFTQSGCNRHL